MAKKHTPSPASVKEDLFKFWLPAAIVKGSTDATGKVTMKMGGIASTADVDSDGETLLSSGFDTTYLENFGFVNWHHGVKTSPNTIIGEPTKATLTNKGLYIECELYDKPLSREVYELAELLKAQSKKRSLGFSIEGKVIERDPLDKTKILKASVTGVAITHMPKNPATFAEIIKGEVSGNDFEFEEVEEVAQEQSDGLYIVDVTKPNGHRILVDNNYNVKIITPDLAEKSMSSASAPALMPESLDGVPKDVYLRKGEVMSKIFADHSGISVSSAKHIYELTKAISDMKFREITPDDLNKAYDTLGITKGGTDDEPTTDDAAADDAAAADDDEGEGDGDKDKPKGDDVEKGQNAAPISTGKGAAPKSTAINKALATLMAGQSVLRDDLSKALGEQADSQTEMFKAVGTVLESVVDTVAELKAQMEVISRQPVGVRKSATSAAMIEKSFNGEDQAEDTIVKAVQEGRLFSASKHPKQLKEKLSTLAYKQDGTLDELFAKGITQFESTGSLPAQVLTALKAQGIIVID